MEKILHTAQVFLTILMLFPIGKILFMYSKMLREWASHSPIYWWDKYIEIPRLLNFIQGLSLSACSWLIFKFTDFGGPTIPKTIAVLLNTVSLITQLLVWTKQYENKLKPYIRRKIVHEKIESPFKRGYDLSAALDQLISQKHIDTDIESFINFLNLIALPTEKKIVSHLNQKDLIRFLFIVFNLKEIKWETMERIITHFFVDENNLPYNLKSLNTGVPKVRNEMIYNLDIYKKQKDNIYSIFQEVKQRKH